MPNESDFFVRFWGVRGSIACPGPDYARYGGNTSCLEIRCGGRLMIMDAGTGLKPLGSALLKQNGRPIDADIFLTHTHFDHISGMPFFAPFFQEAHTFRIWAGNLGDHGALRGVLDKMMSAPLFPVPLEALSADISFHDFSAGEPLTPGKGVAVRTAELNHPNGATGYRVEFAGRSIAYITDTEHEDGKLDDAILGLIDGADVFIYDATYTEDEYPKFRGWGHSTWQEGMRLADEAGVGTYVIFHHAPEHDDSMMDGIADEAAQARPGTLVAKEGMVLTP